MPTSVLLAVLAAAGLLALAPALVRRYDATERLAAERAQSTARVLSRRRRRRTVPGRRPINPGRRVVVTLRPEIPESPVSAVPVSAAPVSAVPLQRGLRAVPAGVRRRATPRRRHTPSIIRRRRVLAALLLLNVVELIGVAAVGPGFWIGFAVTGTLLGVYLVHLRNRAVADRRRRVLAALLLLNVVELIGVAAVGPGFWIGFAVTGTLLGVYLVHLRNRAVADRRRRRAQAREAAWLAARQAEVRREQARRAAARRETQRRLAAQKEAVRRAAMGLDDPPTEGSVSYRRAGGLRGRAYEAGGRAHLA